VSLTTEAALPYPSPCRLPLFEDEITGTPVPYAEAYRTFTCVVIKLM